MQILRPKVLITGAHGLLGSRLVTILKNNYEVHGLVRQFRPEFAIHGVQYLEGDIGHSKIMTKIIRALQPKFIINAAAYTQVDHSETEKEACWRINVEGVEYLAKAARLVSSRLIHISTDYVFDGKSGPYRETDRPNPLGYYGRSKLAGENALIASGVNYAIVRTMVLYGHAPGVRANFVIWVIKQLQQGKRIRIVDDQFGNPTLADELAEALVKLAESDFQEVFHISGEEIIDRYHFALEIADEFRLDKSLIEPIKTEELEQAAPRPLNSGFIIEKAQKYLGIQMSRVKSGLKKFKKNYRN